MEHIYSVFGSYVQPEKSQVLEKYGMIKSSLSRLNHLAFTSNFNFFNKKSDLGYYVYVIDLNLPFTPYCVTLFEHNITVLKWDDSGRKLLICDDIGTVKVYQCIEHLYSDWQKIFSRSLPDEKILCASWFSNGSSLIVDSDKKDLGFMANDRIKQNFYEPTVFDYGRKPVVGFVVATKSGLVWVTTFSQNNTFSTKQKSVSPFRRETFNKIDIIERKSGGFLMSFCDHFDDQNVQIYELKIRIENSLESFSESRKPVLDFRKVGSICLQQTNSEEARVKKPIKFMKWLKSMEALVVVMNGKKHSEIQLWKLEDLRSDNMNGNGNDNNGVSNGPKRQKFHLFCSTKSESFVTSVAVANGSIFSGDNLFDCIVIAQTNNLVKCLSCKDLQAVTTVSLGDFDTKRWSNQLRSGNSSGSYSSSYSSDSGCLQNILPLRQMEISWSNSVLVGLDTFSQIHLFKLTPIFSPSLDFAYYQYFLEYCVYSGNDFWDIMISLKSPPIHQIGDKMRLLTSKLTKSFYMERYGKVKEKFNERVQCIQIAFHRCLHMGNLKDFTCSSADYQTIKNIRAIAETMDRVIRSRSDMKDQESPMERLEQIIVNEPVVNIDNYVSTIDVRDFIVEPPVMVAFQHQLQWICDLTLYLLSLIPHYDDRKLDKNSPLKKFGILGNKEVLKILRQILIVIRCWSLDKGAVQQSAMPTFLKKQGIDIIANMFKLLTKIAINNCEIDDSLIEECCLIPKNVTIAQMETIPMSIGVANPVFFSSDKPFRFLFAEDPEEDLRYEVKFPRVQGAIQLFDGCRMDNTRFISLGSIRNDSHNVRACSRCNSLSLMKISKGPAPAPTRAWDQQWVKRCSCGGFWRSYAYKFQNYV